MKLYDGGRAPNPRRTRIFLAEKGITLPMEQVDIGAMAQMSPTYAAINPLKRVPALVLDDGTVITESIAICRYFEALKPDPPLFGRGALEVARIECGIGASNCIFIALLDSELRDRPFIAGDAFTVADMTSLVAVDFMKPAKLAVPDEFKNLKRWHADVAVRPSASA